MVYGKMQWLPSFSALWLPVPSKVSTVNMVFIGQCGFFVNTTWFFSPQLNAVSVDSGDISFILVRYLSDCIVNPLFDQFIILCYAEHNPTATDVLCFISFATLVVISFPVLGAAHFLNILLVRDTFASYYNSNYVVWHRPLRLLVCLFSSSKHTFIRFWLCMTTAFGSVKGFHSHALPPWKNKSSSQKKMARLGSDPAGCLEDGVTAEPPRDAVEAWHDRHHAERWSSPPSVNVNVDGWLYSLWPYELCEQVRTGSYYRDPLNLTKAIRHAASA